MLIGNPTVVSWKPWQNPEFDTDRNRLRVEPGWAWTSAHFEAGYYPTVTIVAFDEERTYIYGVKFMDSVGAESLARWLALDEAQLLVEAASRMLKDYRSIIHTGE